MDGKKFLKDVSGTFLLVFLASVLGYTTRIIFARNLSQQDYGLFYAIVGFFAFFALFRTLGTNEALVHFLPKYAAQKNLSKAKFSSWYAFKVQSILGLVTSLVFFIFAKPIALHFFHLEAAAQLLRIQSVTYFIIGFVEFFVGFFRGLQRPMLASLYDPVRLFFVTVVSIILIKLQVFTIHNLLFVWMGGYLILSVIYFIYLYKDYGNVISAPSRFYPAVLAEIKRYSIPVMLAVGAEILFSRTNVLLLTFFKGSADVALYEIAYPSSRLMLLLAAPFSFVLFPLVSQLFYQKNKKAISEILQTTYNTGLFLLVPIVALLMLYPELIIKTLFSEKYLAAAPSLRIMTLGTFFLTFSNINFNIISGMGKIASRTKIVYIVALFNIIADVLLIPRFGYQGAIIATSGSFFLLWLLGFKECLHYVSAFRPRLRPLGKIVVNLLIFLTLIIVLKKLFVFNMYVEAIAVTIIGLLLYFLLGLFVFKIINVNILKEKYAQLRK
jgi:O-antigen/teichoic acid export membrane protein